jgi:predicted DNA-binding transcriptional regulator AlpA
MSKYKLKLTIPEAALVWSGISLEELLYASYPNSPAVPYLDGLPLVGDRAEALIDATENGQLHVCNQNPDYALLRPEDRKIARKDLIAFIEENWPEDMALASGKTTPAPETVAPVAFDDQWITEEAVQVKLGIKHSTIWRRIATGKLPPPGIKRPNRWLLSTINALLVPKA